jgi:hypothetical protein
MPVQANKHEFSLCFFRIIRGIRGKKNRVASIYPVKNDSACFVQPFAAVSTEPMEILLSFSHFLRLHCTKRSAVQV